MTHYLLRNNNASDIYEIFGENWLVLKNIEGAKLCNDAGIAT